MEAWLDAIFTVEWLLGASMGIAFHRLGHVVERRILGRIGGEKSEDTRRKD